MTPEEREEIEQEIRNLEQFLYWDAEYGDWKMNKCKEYEILEKECPFTEDEMKDYNTKRDEVRTKIEELRKTLDA